MRRDGNECLPMPKGSDTFEESINQISQKCEYWERNGNSDNAVEAEVRPLVPYLLRTLGISQSNISPEYQCSNGRRVDFAASFLPVTSPSPITKPDLLVELKKPSIKFKEGASEYIRLVSQLRKYFDDQECNSVKYGIIFNGRQVQLFRKHGKLSYPISSILSVNHNEINKTIKYLQKNIQKDEKSRGTIITVWNNRGGVGKTTIAQSLGILISEKIRYGAKERNRVLLIDYDHNQGDLTANCKMERSEGMTKVILEADYLDKLTREKINTSLKSFTNIPVKGRSPRFPFKVKVIRADAEISLGSQSYRNDYDTKSRLPLRNLCLKLSADFDYIIIDSPPNFEQSIFSQEAISAADCILPLADYQNANSIRNYANFILRQIKDVQNSRADGGPYSLGIWINRWRSTWISTVTRNTVKNVINNVNDNKDKLELKRIFYKNSYRELRRIPEAADIARSIMDARGLPGVVRFIRARQAFEPLLKVFVD